MNALVYEENEVQRPGYAPFEKKAQIKMKTQKKVFHRILNHLRLFSPIF